jgi:uncharacterized protein (DUF1810 family)
VVQSAKAVISMTGADGPRDPGTAESHLAGSPDFDPAGLTCPDPYDLDRFVQAQRDSYDRALSEIRAGWKRTHWMWFIFPQLEGLGSSPTARKYAIKSLDEARAYLRHEVLGRRLVDCAEAALSVPGSSAHDIFGSPDDWKLHSSATLFALVSPPGSAFERLLVKYFRGEQDQKTLALLGMVSG